MEVQNTDHEGLVEPCDCPDIVFACLLPEKKKRMRGRSAPPGETRQEPGASVSSCTLEGVNWYLPR